MEYIVTLATPLGTLEEVRVMARDAGHALEVLEDMLGPVEADTISIAHTGECIWRGPPSIEEGHLGRIWRRMVTG